MDVKTLRLASIALTEALLMKYLAYERALVAELDRTDGQGDWSGRFAFAHQHALHEAQLDGQAYQKLRALVGDYCSRRGAIDVVQRRLAAARAHEPATASPAERSLIERAERELPGLRQLDDLEARYGGEAVALLTQHEEAVLASHREVARREGCHRL